jgi:amino acid adenylation domain-containing protein
MKTIPKKTIEDIYPLSPLQQGLLFHTLYAPGSGVYVEQFVCRVRGALDVEAFLAAFRQVIARHPALRAAYRWKDLDQPLQVVHRHVELPFEQHDWRGLEPLEQQQQLADYLQADRQRGFVPSRAPLLRLALLRRADDAYDVVWSCHHVIMDGWSMSILLGEVLALYEAACQGRELRLPPCRPYRDYIAWLQAQDLAEAEAYWRRTLTGFRSATPLGIDAWASASASLASFGEQEVRLSPEETAALGQFARRHQLTLNTLVQGAWAIVLGRYSGQSDVVFGTTVAGRPSSLAGVETMVGLFINTLPLRVGVPGSAQVVPWLRALQTCLLEARQYEFSPLARVLQWSEVPRGKPLFETAVVFENFPQDAGLLARSPSPRLAVESVALREQTNFPLTLVAEPGVELVLKASYDGGRIEAGAIERLLGHLQTLLGGFVAGSAIRLADLPLLTPAERRRVVVEWNRSEVPTLDDRLIVELFEAQVDRTPGAIALGCGEAHLTYRELNARANRLAHRLMALGVGPERRVGICLERTPEMIIALLAVLKAGGAYVPLDPAYPAARLEFMLEDARVAVLLVDRQRDLKLPQDAAPRVLCLDGLDEGLSGGEDSDTNPDCRTAPENLAYIIYTSGSTGAPKGVMVTHGALANFLQSFRASLGMTERDELAAVTTLSFDIAALELFLPLIVGARVTLLGRDEAADGARLKQRLTAGGATFLQATPATWRLLLDADWAGSPGTTLLCGGEALTRALADRLIERGRALWNLYGPTETTIWSSAQRVEAGAGRVSIGRPIARTTMDVLDAEFQPVPVGVVGDLYIGGAGVARGYMGRSGLTAERFVPDPFGAEPGARLYRTGDLARRLPDGRLECLGRGDHQVKVRGYRIELGEIEATLARHPAVRQAAVVAREDTPGDQRLVAYLVGDVPAASELRAWLRRWLPEYMVPAVYHRLDRLPITPNGKIDRKALPAPDNVPHAELRAIVPPRGPIEEAVVAVWAEVLAQPPASIGIHDSFFDLGGHSLLATRLGSRLRDLFGVEMPLRVLFEAPTVAAVASWIEEARHAGLRLELPPLVPAERPPALPPSFAQQALWFLDRLAPGQATFNMPIAVRVTGPLDVQAFERSLAEIVRRHEALRTQFVEIDGRPFQVVAPELTVPLTIEELGGLEPAEREATVRRRALAEARQPFDLVRGPLFRASVLKLGDQEHVILLTMHHIIGDGWSFGVAAGELAALYEANRRGDPSPLPPLPIQYADYALWQRGWLQGALRDRLVDYWSRRLAGVTPLELPVDRARPPIRTSRGAIHLFTIPETLTGPLGLLCRREGVTPFMLLLAAFQTLLHRYSGQDDIVVGSPVANRTRSEVEGLIGYFVNMLALRTDLAGDPSFTALLARVRETALGAYEHQDLPFEMVVEALRPPHDPSRTPLFNVMFVLQNNRLPDLGRFGLGLAPLSPEDGAGTGTAKFDLTLLLEETAAELSGGLEYNTDLFDAATIERMARHFQTLLGAIVADPGRRLSELAWLDADERRLVLETYSGGSAAAAAIDKEGSIHERFEAQVERTPDAIALVFGTEQLTYCELNARANRLAWRLAALGFGRERVVGVCAGRSPAMIVGLLGVLKAGAAYMPLDPELPAGRLAALIEESRVELVLAPEDLRATLPAGAARIMPLEDTGVEAGRTLEARPATAAAPGNLAYVIYTSGSTGRPKGVMVAHASLVDAARAWQECYGLGPGLRHLQAAGFSFDVFTGDWVRALTTGGTLVSCPREALLDPSALAALLRDERIDCVELVPAVVEALASELERTGRTLAPLRLLVVGSDTLQSDLFRRLRRLAGPDARVVNSYGLTEATIDSTFYEEEQAAAPGCALALTRPSATLSLGERVWGAAPIGRPFGKTRVYVLDAWQGPLPPGVAGELYIGGSGVVRGYRGRADLTAARFVPDPFGRPGGRLYRTGDLGRWRRDGVLELLGRTDHQVKVRGVRIELGEVEAAVRRHPAVREAVIDAREDPRGNKRLVAYVVPRAGAELGLVELRRWLQKTLPEPMIPSALVRLESLPLSANGKVDRGALPEPGPMPQGEGADYVAPRTPLEETLARVWAEVLEVERVGVHDSFFDLGGHSLQSVQLVARLTATLNRPVSVKTVFQAPTVAAMAEVLERDPAATNGLSPDGRARFHAHAHAYPNGNGNGNGNGHGDARAALARWLDQAGPVAAPEPAHVAVESRPVETLFTAAALGRVDSVALGYFPSSLLQFTGLDAATVIHGWCGNRPLCAGVRETPLGRVGMVFIPRFDDQLYHDRRDLLAVLADAVRLAGESGAATVSLTGLLPSATDYGRALFHYLGDDDLPQITTGHATTTSAVVMAVRRALAEAGRNLAGEHVGFVGLGSVGVATLRLLLSCLPHPAALTLCDVYSKQEDLEALGREVAAVLGFEGALRILPSRREVPAELYEASLIVGATNVAEILDIDRLTPGTIVVDDSAPHLFHAGRALQRFHERRDILVAEGGVLAAPAVLPLVVGVPEGLEPWLQAALVSLVARSAPHEITGCVLSGLLSARFPQLAPTVGLIDRQTALDHYEVLGAIRFEAARLHLEDAVLDPAVIQEFRLRYGQTLEDVPLSPVSQH